MNSYHQKADTVRKPKELMNTSQRGSGTWRTSLGELELDIFFLNFITPMIVLKRDS